MPKLAEPTERTCAVTRVTKPIDALIRFVRAPDGTLVADLKRRLPGRGVWVSASADTVAMAERRHVFARAFDQPVGVPSDLAGRVDTLLLAAATGALALSRKAGALVGGFAKVEAALAREPVLALIHASEAGADGVAKLTAVADRRFGRGGLPAIRIFGAEQLDLAFGRTNVIHAALLAGPAGANVLARVGDLVRYRGDDDPGGALDGSFDALAEVNDLSRRTVGTP